MLLESRDKNGALTKYLADHGQGIIGLSVEVADLSKARQLAESGTGRKLETYKGFYGPSFLLPPDVTHGVWMEMFQPAEHSRGKRRPMGVLNRRRVAVALIALHRLSHLAFDHFGGVGRKGR